MASHDERLEWRSPIGGVWQAMGVRPQRKANVLYVFATVRPLINANGLLQGNGWGVMRTGFEDLREFDTLADAQLYVESLYELEKP